MSNPNREYDKTHLSIDMAEERGIMHRDYIAHCTRWSHVVKFLYKLHHYKTARILDVGCGREVPLAKLLYSNKMSGAKYVGVDYNALEMPEMLKTAVTNMKMEVTLKGGWDAGDLVATDLPWSPNVLTSFECFEHMTPKAARRMVETMYDLAEEGAHLFFSTPCWNGSAAANHINETTYEAMGALLEDVGWYIEDHYGTFASQSDYKHKMGPEELDIFNRLAEYYDSNMLACLMAPLFPKYSRNVLWHCSKGGTLISRRFPPLYEIAEPWSQHPNYLELKP